MNKYDNITVLGSNGMVGRAIVRDLNSKGYVNVHEVTRNIVDLTNQNMVNSWFNSNRPQYVFLCAAKVGGIMANNSEPADFGYNNGIIELNVLNAAFKSNVKKLLFLGSSCIYPRLAPQPLKEEYLLTSALEPTNELYALAKIFGLRLCQAYNKQYGCNFISCMPTNLYGYFDNFSLKSGHVLPALLRKYHEAKINNTDVTCFGTGNVFREFMYVDDLADACTFLMNNYNDNETINIGTGIDVTIKQLSEEISKVVGFTGITNWDTSKPDGTPRKLLDVSKLNGIGWYAKTNLQEGLNKTYSWYLENINNIKEN